MKNLLKLRILVVEDDVRMLDLLCQGLREIGHTVMPASDGQAGLELATGFAFDVIVLDIGLPRCNGFDLTLALRSEKSATPVLMLTARDTQDDIIQGLELGADDYLTKPFSFPELVARIHRLGLAASRISSPPGLVLDHGRLVALRENTAIYLTRTEFLLLSALKSNAGTTVTRKALVDAVWGDEHAVGTNALDVLMNALRNKLDVPFSRKLLQTVRGVGYRLELHDKAVLQQELAS